MCGRGDVVSLTILYISLKERIYESLAESDLVSGSEKKRGIDNILPERSASAFLIAKLLNL